MKIQDYEMDLSLYDGFSFTYLLDSCAGRIYVIGSCFAYIQCKNYVNVHIIKTYGT